MKILISGLVLLSILPVAFMAGCGSSSPTSSNSNNSNATATITATPVNTIVPAGPTALNVGTASSFAVLANTGVTNDAENICGNFGLFPGSSSTSTYSFTCTGNTQYINDPGNVAQGAQAAIFAATTGAYNVAMAMTSPTLISASLGSGQSLAPGFYSPSTGGSFSLSGTLTLNNTGGNPNNVYIFTTGTTATPGTTITTAASSQLVLVNVKAANVFWVAGTGVNLGASSSFAGNILASTTIVFGGTVALEGHAYSDTAITFSASDTITNP